MNNLGKIQGEYHSTIADNHTIWLKIRFTPGMEMLAQEMSTGRRIFEQDTSHFGSPVGEVALDDTEVSPSISPSSPSLSSPSLSSPAHATAVTRRRSQRWMLDATGSFPTLFIEERLVSFYATIAEMQQAIADRGPHGRNKVIINIAHVISVEKVITRCSFAQSVVHPDVEHGINGQEPAIIERPLVILEPTEIPLLTQVDQELMFKVRADGGQPPYRYSMINAPRDLYVTEDGWLRGFIEADQWPTTGFREFITLILVEDSSIPVQTAGLEFRYRLYPHA